LLVDRDACGHLKTWHAEGGVPLSEEQATDLVLAALPGGGPRLVLDAERHAKSYLTAIGIMVAIWKPRPGAQVTPGGLLAWPGGVKHPVELGAGGEAHRRVRCRERPGSCSAC
jgi:hypothetical protein